MNDWITSRRPDWCDAVNDCVWVVDIHGQVVMRGVSLTDGRPWKPIEPPAAYEKPKHPKNLDLFLLAVDDLLDSWGKDDVYGPLDAVRKLR